jgi:ATP-binding cassette subfamily B multidrug efflux pump
MFRWFESRLAPFPDDAPTEPPKGLVAFCRHYARGVWPAISVMAVLTAIIAIAEVSLYAFLGSIVDWLSQRSPATLWAQEGNKLLWMGALALGLPLVTLTQSSLIHQTLLGNFPMRIRWSIHRYLLGQSMAYFQNEFSGRVATKVMQTSLAVRDSVMKVLDVLNYVTVYFVGALVIAASADRRLLVPFCTWLILYFCLLRFFIPRLRDASEQQADARSTMTGRIVDSYTNIATVKLFSHAKREEAYAKEGMQGFLSTVHRQMRLITGFWVTLYVLNSVLLVAVASLSIHLWTTSAISVGAVAVAIGLVIRLSGMAQWIMWEVSALFENIGTVEDGITSIAVPRAVQDKPDAARLDVPHGTIRLDGVSFGYGHERNVLQDLSLEIKAGERVGLVGRSGAGKSTLVNLLLRFHDVSEGRVLIDGQDLANVSQESLRANIGVVTQDTSLLHRSVRENIVYGRPDASETDMLRAARDASAHDFILDLEDKSGRRGYDAHVGERGVTLSGGQRQRIAIARVMLKDAPLLILDEATSALDSEVEAAIQESLDRLMAGKTVLAIAHRLSTIAALDRLLVMDEGRIVEDGTHDALLARGGIYAKLWARQSGGFLGLDAEATGEEPTNPPSEPGTTPPQVSAAE